MIRWLATSPDRFKKRERERERGTCLIAIPYFLPYPLLVTQYAGFMSYQLGSGWLAKAENVRKCHEFVSFAYFLPLSLSLLLFK